MTYKIIGKYIKELNFNIPKAKTFFLLSQNISNYKINIDIKSSQIKQNIIEVLTTLALKPTTNDFEKIDTKIVYSTIVEVDNNKINKQEMEKMKEQFKIDKAKLILEQELKEKTMNHEQIIYLTTKIIEKAMGLEEAKIDRDKIRKWIGEISDKKEKDENS